VYLAHAAGTHDSYLEEFAHVLVVTTNVQTLGQPIITFISHSFDMPFAEGDEI
jgi:hypothetical protein